MTGPQLDRVGAMNDQSLTLPDEGALLSLYYDGARLPSPSGGFLIVLGVQAEDDGTGSVLLECMSSSLRYEVTVPKGTRSERKKVRDKMASGADPKCPRHQGQLLARIRHDLACLKCGVRYAKAK
jgi:hypothetical protein